MAAEKCGWASSPGFRYVPILHGLLGLERCSTHPGTERSREQNGHNHPSGDPTPSPEDIATTEKIMRTGVIVGIPVVDHVIVTRERSRYSSLLERGILPQVY